MNKDPGPRASVCAEKLRLMLLLEQLKRLSVGENPFLSIVVARTITCDLLQDHILEHGC